MTRGRIAAVLLAAGMMAGATLSSAPRADAATKPPRLVAFHWAKTQAGKPYLYGGTGPNGYDCSGLVYEAYRHAGFALPRTTQDMLASGKFGRTSSPRAGELAFFGTGHVEFVTNERHTTYGALHSAPCSGGTSGTPAARGIPRSTCTSRTPASPVLIS